MKRQTEILTDGDYTKDNSPITKIKDLPSTFSYEDDGTIIEANIFGIDMIVYENNLTILTLKLSDLTGSLIARVAIPNSLLCESLEKVRLGSTWRFYGECFNKKYDGLCVIKMVSVSKNTSIVIDKEQEKYFFFEPLDIETVKARKKDELKNIL